MAPRNTRQAMRSLARRAPAVFVLVCALVLSVLAIVHQGVTTTEVDVDDGGIWVTNASKRLVGHLNYESRTLDAALRTQTVEFDLGQTADLVTLQDRTAHSLTPVDVAKVGLGAATSLPEGAASVQGGDRVGVIDPAEGNLWITQAANPSSTAYTEETALATDLDAGVVTTSHSGQVFAASAPAGRLTSVRVDGEINRTETTTLAGIAKDADLSLTTVGDQPILLDRSSLNLRLPDGTVRDLSKEGVSNDVVLQEPGPEATSVVMASGTALFSVPLDGGALTSVPASRSGGTGKPAPPVVHRGCTYGAWSTTGAYLRTCQDPSANVSMVVDTLKGAAEPRFRTNRTRIVLNDVRQGAVWLPEENMVLMQDWDQVENELDKNDDKEVNPDVSEQISDPETREKNTPPEAQDDSFGVRPGRTATLPVLANDSDTDGDVLTARPVTTPGFGTVARTRGGRALQITGVPDQAGATTSFTYEASDGQAVDTATVTVDVHPWDVNGAPERQRDANVKLGANAQIEYNVLPDWLDPDGDPIFLAGAAAPEGLDVQFHEEGTLVIRDLGATPGLHTIDLQVSDGTDVGKDVLSVNVQAPGNIPPVANADFYVARKGETITLEPLANDSDSNGDTLSLAAVASAPAGTVLTPDLDLSTLSFTAQTPGSYQFTYTVTDGPATVLGIIRVDVVDLADKAVPVAEDDLVVLPAGGSALVAPLNNDTDPGGGVLVVQQISPDEASGLEVTLVDRHLLRITAPGGLDKAVSFPYTVSNGTNTATALVTVVPTKALDSKQPPELRADSAKVRVGDVGSVQVLANDRSPAGLAMKVDTKLDFEPDPEVGTPFVTGNLVRLEAGTKPGVMHVGYTVHDSAGNSASSTVTFQVLSRDGANAQPQPKPLTAWAASGETARIPVPLHGIDPDGDSVTLVGIEQSPTKGTVALGVDWLEYTPSTGATGTDVFTYIVEDRRGKQATARVRVGIAPPASYNQAPIAVPDVVLAKPNRRLAVAVLANDLDADGDPMILQDSLQTNDPTLKPRVNGSTVVMTTPATSGTYVVSYLVTDGRGGSGRGTLTVNVSEDAILQAPIARDDVVSVSDLPQDGGPVTVSVLDNDEDPDGDASQLTVSTKAAGVRVSGKQLVITPEPTRRLVVYTVTDPDGLSASAVVSVAGLDRTHPVVDETRVPIEVRAGEELSIDVTDYVLVRTGRSPRIVNAASLKVSTGIDAGARVTDATHVSLRAAKDYSGKASVSFEVRDGAADDDSALSAIVAIPLVITSTSNKPPTLQPTPISVAPGEEATPTDLSLMVNDPDGADPTGFTYTLLKAPESVVVGLEGHTLSTQVGVDTPKGAAGAVTVSVDDGSGAVLADIPVTVVASTRPKIQVSDAVVEAASAGAPQTIDLTQYTINPFPETPIKVTGATVQQGEGTVDPQGTTLTITPAAGYHGDMVVTYRLLDATNDADRAVEGRVRLAVKDRPDAPTIGEVTSPAAGVALVNFIPGKDNNSPITKFTVSTSPETGLHECSSGSCLVQGLANGQSYSFRVKATNAIGDSDWSGYSAEVLVDVKPGQVTGVQAVAGESSAQLTWLAPDNSGSPIVGYVVTVVGDGVRQDEVGAATSATIDNLKPGVTYHFTVKARNSHPDPGPDSPPSNQVIPYGRPGAPTNVGVVATLGDDQGAEMDLAISWALGAVNGAAYDAVELEVGSRVISLTGPATSYAVRVPAAPSVHIGVRARNGGGLWSDWTRKELPIKGKPKAPTGLKVAATGAHGQLQVTVSKQAGHGFSASEISLEWSTDGASWRRLNSSVIDVGTDAAVTVMVRQNAGGVAGPHVSADAQAWGPLNGLRISTHVQGDRVTVNWFVDKGPSWAPNPDVTFTVQGGAGGSYGPYYSQTEGSFVLEGHWNTTYEIQGRAVGQHDTSVTGSARATTPPRDGSAWGGWAACTPEQVKQGEDPATCVVLTVSSKDWEATDTLRCSATDSSTRAVVNFQVPANTEGARTDVRIASADDGAVGAAGLSCRRP
ncbi:tandem-95 repeat protein [Schaalia sp. 19OD2882]|uniref:fibronectin type III domain-containing protein n=1 Tax=Schaalia sp. 19OD2882 TaxID=2794089 RepID=UPI001C1F0E75|nr:fibronectin type III domain-containing protein [Schaalia sp. 19OD2882]QWW19812.1 tandem-95 repeat protein [Schaalia sp. 19OD2882]